jgi:anti-sigma B factor antagonist
MNRLHLHIRRRDESAVISVAGEIDIASAGQLDNCIRKARSQYSPHLIIDLVEADFMGSAGLQVLAHASTDLESHGGSVVIARPSDQVTRLLKIDGLHHGLAVYRTVELALNRRRPDSSPQPAWRWRDHSSAGHNAPSDATHRRH